MQLTFSVLVIIFGISRFLSSIIFPVWRNFFNIFWSAGLLVNSLNAWISEIDSTIIFERYFYWVWNSRLQFFIWYCWNVALLVFLAWVASKQKFSVFVFFILLCVMCHFLLTAFFFITGFKQFNWIFLSFGGGTRAIFILDLYWAKSFLITPPLSLN